MLEEIVPYLPFLGLIIGACLQYFFTKQIEYSRDLRALKSAAYMNYLNGICKLSQAVVYPSEVDSERESNNYLKMANAKSRICIYGSNSVIRSFSKFQQLGSVIGTNEQKCAFIEMAEEMRKDIGISEKLSTEDLGWVLLGKQVNIK